MLNPDLDTAALAREFAIDRRVRIPAVLDADTAERLASIAASDLPYLLITYVDDRSIEIPPDGFAKLTREQLEAMQRQIGANAANGVGYLYEGYRLGPDQAGAGDDTAFLQSVFEALNSEEMLGTIAAITGADDLKSADAQITRYGPGHFLTRHQDHVGPGQRRLAFVFSFASDWHPDWGGLLQFFEKDGTPRDAWTPAYNVLSLFDVTHVHSVTYVAPFAPQPRLSLTGWFRAKPW